MGNCHFRVRWPIAPSASTHHHDGVAATTSPIQVVLVLHLTHPHAAAIADHAQQTYPEECCGLLLGVVLGGNQRYVLAVRPVRNAWDDEIAAQLATVMGDGAGAGRSRRDRFWIDPQDLFQAQREARTLSHPQGCPELIGVYHSHPDHDARPSERDRRCAWFTYSYIIVAVHHGVPQDLLCWTLDSQHQFQPEPLILQPDPVG
jgi:proteasome lid subunit RPN8/RPN11